MLFQLFIPFLLLIYLLSRYQNGEETVIIATPIQVTLLICVLIVSFIAEAAQKLVRGWDSPETYAENITYGACVSIMAFNRFSGAGAIMPTDMHHTFENIIAYSQVVELGQKLFSECIPVSGLYSFVQGAVFAFFGDGKLSNYYLTNNVFYLLVILLIVALLRKHIDKASVLFIVLIFTVIDYNRVTFILPIMLLLTLPELIERKNLWLKLWLLTSLFHGLYYPVMGAATCLAFAPLGIWQLVTFIRSGEWKKQVRKASFWLTWAVCLLPVLLAVPFLLGTYRHIVAMAAQTILADGIARFGQLVPDYFFAYIPFFTVRLMLYYLFTFMIPAGMVWVAAAMAANLVKMEKRGKRIKITEIKGACIVLSIAIMLLVVYSYTTVRLDPGYIYARSEGPLSAAAVMLIVFGLQYFKKSRMQGLIIGIAFFIPGVIASFGLCDNSEKLTAQYAVPEGYIYVQDDTVERLGTGFIKDSLYETIETSYAQSLQLDGEQSYFALYSSFGFYYLNNVKGDSVMESGTVEGYDAAVESAEVLLENQTLVGTEFSVYENYYLYYWLMTSGDYVWSSEKEYFEPNMEGLGVEEAQEKNKECKLADEELSLGKSAGAMGRSMDSLEGIFTEVSVGYETMTGVEEVRIQLRESLKGNQADFLYLKFSDVLDDCRYTLFDNLEENECSPGKLCNYFCNKNYNMNTSVFVHWLDDEGQTHSIECNLDQGKLLIPLGAGVNWLLNEHSEIWVTVEEDGAEAEVPEITELRFLKLREVATE